MRICPFLAHADKESNDHSSEIIGRLPYMRATVTFVFIRPAKEMQKKTMNTLDIVMVAFCVLRQLAIETARVT